MARIRDGDEGDVGDDEGSARAHEGALGELITLEAQIESQVAGAQAEALRIVEEARRSTQSADGDGASSLDSSLDSLEEAIGSLRASIETECAASVRALGERARIEAERYRSVNDATLSRLSRWVGLRILQGWESP